MQDQIKQLPFRSILSVLCIKTTSSLISAIDTILEQCGLATWLPIRYVDVYIVSSFFCVIAYLHLHMGSNGLCINGVSWFVIVCDLFSEAQSLARDLPC